MEGPPNLLRPFFADKFYNICISLILVGGFVCFIPVFVLQSFWPNILNDREGDVLPLFISVIENYSVQQMATITFSLTIPSMIDAAFDVVESFLTVSSVVSHVTHQVVGINVVERVLFLLGIQVSSLLFVCLGDQNQLTNDIASQSKFDNMPFRAAILIASISCSFVLSGGALLLCLHRLFYTYNSQRTNSLGTIWNIVSIVIGSILFSVSSVLRIGQSVSDAGNSGNIDGNKQLAYAAASFYTVAMVAFIRSTVIWITGFFSTRKRKREDQIKSADQVFVPTVLIFTFALSAVAVFVPSFETLVPADNSRTTVMSLNSYYGLNMLTALMLIVLEKRLKNIEINRGLEALESKRSFVRYISHEVRTPLNTVSLGLELLTEELLVDDSELGRGYLESLSHIRNASSVAVEILNDLLQYDKMQDNILHLQKKSISALEVISDVVGTFKLQAKKAGVQLVQSYVQPSGSASLHDHGQAGIVSIEDYLLLQQSFIEADRPKIAQVLRNLVSNALKFTPTGGRVTVSVRLATRLATPKHPTIATAVGSADDDNPIVIQGRLSRHIRDILGGAVCRLFGLPYEVEGSVQAPSGLSSPAVSLPQPQGGAQGAQGAASPSPRASDRNHNNHHKSPAAQAFTPPTAFGRILHLSARKSGRTSRGQQVAPAANDNNSNGTKRLKMPKYIIIEVTDTGAGIEKENIGRVFNEIVQFNPNELQGGGGSGLGLVLSRGIVNAHRGKIWLTSEGVGKGCTFSVGLPVTVNNPSSPITRAHSFLDPLQGLLESSMVGQQVGKVITAGAEMVQSGGRTLGSFLVPASLGGSGSKVLISGGGGGLKSQGGSSRGLVSRTPSRAINNFGTTPQRRINSGNVSHSNSSQQGAGGGGGGAGAAGRLGATVHERVSARRSLASGNVSPAGALSASQLANNNIQLHSGVMSLRSSLSSSNATNRGNNNTSFKNTGGAHNGGGGGWGDDGGISPHDSRIGSSDSRHSGSNASVKWDGGDAMVISRRASSASNIGREEQLFMQRHYHEEQKDGGVGGDSKDMEQGDIDQLVHGLCSVGMSLANAPVAQSPLYSFIMDPRSNIRRGDGSPGGDTATPVGPPKKVFIYHVLVVDDSSLNRRMLCKALTAIGCSTDEAEDGAVAVAMVKRTLPDRSADSSRTGSIMGMTGLSAFLNKGGGASLKEEMSYRSSSNISGAADGKSLADSKAAVTALANNLARGSFASYHGASMDMGDHHHVGRNSLIARATMEAIAASMAYNNGGPLSSDGGGGASNIDLTDGVGSPGAAAAVAGVGDQKRGTGARRQLSLKPPQQVQVSPLEKQYDFILCDNVMPRMDGPTAVQKIRAMGYINPIFGVTGNVLPSDVNDFIDKGANDVLAKPLKLSLLKEAIRIHVAPPSKAVTAAAAAAAQHNNSQRNNNSNNNSRRQPNHR